MKQTDALKLTCATAFVAALGMGCASTGYARYDADSMDNDRDVGVSAAAEVGTDADVAVDVDTAADTRIDADSSSSLGANTTTIVADDVGGSASAQVGSSSDMDYRTTSYDSRSRMDAPDTEGEAQATVSALSFSPETRASWVNRFPFYDQNWRLRTIETYTFVADSDFDLDSDAPDFRADLPEGSVYVEAAGGADSGTQVIRHSPNPVR